MATRQKRPQSSQPASATVKGSARPSPNTDAGRDTGRVCRGPGAQDGPRLRRRLRRRPLPSGSPQRRHPHARPAAPTHPAAFILPPPPLSALRDFCLNVPSRFPAPTARLAVIQIWPIGAEREGAEPGARPIALQARPPLSTPSLRVCRRGLSRRARVIKGSPRGRNRWPPVSMATGKPLELGLGASGCRPEWKIFSKPKATSSEGSAAASERAARMTCLVTHHCHRRPRRSGHPAYSPRPAPPPSPATPSQHGNHLFVLERTERDTLPGA